MLFQSKQVPLRSLEEVLREASGPVAVIAGDTTIVHEGAVAVKEGRGDGRMAQLRDAMKATHFDHDGPQPPLWSIGVGFASGDDWLGFPDAQAVLPKRQWLWRDGQLFETTSDAPQVSLAGGAALPRSRIDAERWMDMVNLATRAIRDGRITKVVLARSSVGPHGDPIGSMLRMRELEDGTPFLFRRGRATFYGCTPERLVRLQGGHVQTHALAGTARLARAAELALADKDILEHELVAAFVRERLVEAGIRDVQQEDRRQRRLRHVAHLETPVTGTAPDGTHILDVAAQLHPTPAVCGTPRRRSLALIQDLEDVPRGWYAGAVGWCDAGGEGELHVALRCAHAVGGVRTMFAGAGIVAGSRPEAEWQETEDKLATLLEAS